MRVLITGAAGFLGCALARELARAGALAGRDGGLQPITQVVLADRAPCPAPEGTSFGVVPAEGDLSDPAFVSRLAARGFDSIFHLAASLTLDAEHDPEAAFAVNVEAVRHLISASSATAPRIIFTSSIAVFGGSLPDTVGDTVRLTPTTTYGTHKAIVELLLEDATRHGWIDGRALRLPIVLIRPGAATPAISDRVAAIVREPLAGRDVVCPLVLKTRMPVASASAVARALIRLHDIPASSLPSSRAMNLPALTVSVADIVEAIERQRVKAQAIGRITIQPDPVLQAIVDGWPKRFVSVDASRLGLGSDASFDAILAEYLAGLEPTRVSA
jgi:nucleoside-diphosphate-sugar epimerase